MLASVQVSRVRRPRFYEHATDAWSLFQPFQTWEQGVVWWL